MKKPLIVVTSLLMVGLTFAQRGRMRGWGGEGGWIGEDTRTAREVAQHSTETPVWTNPKSFEKDVFTFVRIRYDNGRFGYGGGSGWGTDTPDSDLNLSYRLQQMTSMKVDPNGRYIRLTDPELADYPFVYIVEPGGLYLSEQEATALRKYLTNGGFLLLDDFWGEDEWSVMESQIKKALPERNFVEIPLSHPIYSCVFKITAKGQVPGIRSWQRYGETSERGYDSQTTHHRAIFDDKGRIMVIALHNTDNGDGWEREGENQEYFKNFSEKIAYPLGINIIFYVMTH
jgi:hypothetical protein